ncbi:MAG: metallophosphoesterase [Dehalococcoidia bacterium]|nr:metallophosphoesterase [Dehalococcoidia bacterium]
MRPHVRLLHTSDLHLHWSHARTSLDSIRGLRVAAESTQAQSVLMAGDIFDTADQPAEFVAEVASEINAFEVPIVLIPGNHDIRYSEQERDALGSLGAALRPGHSLLHSIEGASTTLLGGALHVWGRGMAEHSPKNDPLAGLAVSEDPNTWSVVLAHGELMSKAGGLRSSPIILDRHAEALAGVHYVALGHHDDAKVSRWGSTVVCYSGSVSPILGTGDYAVVDLLDPHGVEVRIERLALE